MTAPAGLPERLAAALRDLPDPPVDLRAARTRLRERTADRRRMARRLAVVAVVCVVLVGLVAGVGLWRFGRDDHVVPTRPVVPTGPTGPEEIPSQVSTIPAGVYRTEIPLEAVNDAHISNNAGWTGIWTLEIKDGTYVLSCHPLEMPGQDCGTVVSDAPVEAGDLRGRDHRVFFVGYDVERLAALTGCKPDHSAPEDQQCVTVSPYSVTWSSRGDLLTFSDPGSFGPQAAHLWLRPWTRIAATG
jgi:hypothetical protein